MRQKAVDIRYWNASDTDEEIRCFMTIRTRANVLANEGSAILVSLLIGLWMASILLPTLNVL